MRKRRKFLAAAASLIVLAAVFPATLPALGATVEYRVNAGGPALDDWEEDSGAAPSQYNNVAVSGQNSVPPATVDPITLDATVPGGTPENIFRRMRVDPTGGTPANLEWDFPVTNGAYEVRLYFAETDLTHMAAGDRVFDVLLEGGVVLDDFDIFAEAGNHVGTMRSFLIDVTDANIDIDFDHVFENTAINAIEILSDPDPAGITVDPDTIDLSTEVSTSVAGTVTLTNDGTTSVTIENTSISGADAAAFTDDFQDSPLMLAPGDSLEIEVTYQASGTAGTVTADVVVGVQGSADVVVPVTGEAIDSTATSDLAATNSSLEFGEVAVGEASSRTLTLTNTGTESSILITDAIVQGASANAFDHDADLPTTLQPGESVAVDVSFSPSAVGSADATLRISHNGDNTPLSVPLAGTGVEAADPVSFTDIGGSVFQAEILWLAEEGITRGCNPPDNTLFCPTDEVTRGQMAAFLHRALGDVLTPGEATDFTDDNTSVFEDDIEWLAATGVTRGCNPPTNDQFCPDDPVTREQMAAFLFRALAG
jgi:hypothetical protein